MKYIIEHMEDGFSDWVRLEYQAIAQEVGGFNLWLTSVKEGIEVPDELRKMGVHVTSKDVQNVPEIEVNRVCLLDPAAQEPLNPADAQSFDWFLFGGILGDHPPRDRTGELRRLGFVGRHLGKIQMTTDTAVRVTQLVLDGKPEPQPLEKIPYVDFPELRFNDHESTEMPFRYVCGPGGEPLLPRGMLELIRADADKTLDDLL